MSSPVRRALLALGTIGAAALLLVVTRPGPMQVRLPDAGGASRPPPAAPAATHAPSNPTAAPSHARLDSPSETGPDDRDAGVSDAGAGDASGDLQSWIDHGRSAVVRVDQPSMGPWTVVDRPQRTPDWNVPTSLRFVDLKEHYRAFRAARDFSADLVRELSGAAVVIAGAVMPVDPIVESGEMRRFWLSNPMIVMAGCVFCNPPTMGDLLLVRTAGRPLVVDPERLFRGVVIVKLLGRLRLGPARTEDGIEYLFGMELERALD